MGALYSPKRKRSVEPEELMTAMGWCIDRRTSKRLNVLYFKMRPEDRLNYTTMCGNAMHLAVGTLYWRRLMHVCCKRVIFEYIVCILVGLMVGSLKVCLFVSLLIYLFC
jgi:hypothetical protein